MTGILDAHHRQVVKLRSVADEFVHSRVTRLEDLFGRFVFGSAERVDHAVGAEEFIVGIGSLRYAVGVAEQLCPFLECNLILLVANVIQIADHQSVLVIEQLKAAAGSFERRFLMPGVRGGQLAGFDIEDTEPYGHEHLFTVVLADLPVDLFQSRFRTLLHQRIVLQQNVRRHHKQRRWNTFAGNVSHYHTERIVVNQKEVIEVATNLFRRFHRGVDIKFVPVRKRRKDVREHILLDTRRHGQFCIQPR